MALFRRDRKKFGEMLIEKGLATKTDIEEALKVQKEIYETKRIQKKIGVILHEKGIIDLDSIDDVLNEQKHFNGFILKGLIYSIFHSK
ncbi:MAG: hypothetical protein A2987_04365 [Omnitrophica bacterium RIFCSPLOWO2_01_FULL_45_10]|nr:MAG: hypothetical protein A2987_04365 [Omnitrophica bacterium RIFCSPLOWO2_01_FULL_45_10]